MPVAEEVKIAEPDPPADAKKDSLGRPVSKPIEREKTRLRPVTLALSVGGAIAVVAAAWLLGDTLRDNALLRGLGLALVSPPLAVAAYSILREADLEPHRGLRLWLRAGLCGLVYAALWGAFALLPDSWMPKEIWGWFFVAPPFLIVGAAVALAALDLDFGTGFLHYGFYLLATGTLRWLAGLPALWVSAVVAG